MCNSWLDYQQKTKNCTIRFFALLHPSFMRNKSFLRILASGQVVIGGTGDLGGGYNDNRNELKNVELFPNPPSGACNIPDLPQLRKDHTLSLLAGGRLVVCGGDDADVGWKRHATCISWVEGNTTWTHLYNMR